MFRNIKTFMLGWEFPPFISGGLGTACYGLTRAMSRLGMKITFVLPKSDPLQLSADDEPSLQEPLEELEFQNVKFRGIAARIAPYGAVRSANVKTSAADNPGSSKVGALTCLAGCDYGPEIFAIVNSYADKAVEIAAGVDFDIIHAHDWMTFPAGLAVAQKTGKPLVVQVHSTEFDRSGEHVNQHIYDIERAGMHAAVKVIAVSNYTRNIIISRYGVPAGKVEVAYNGVERNGNGSNGHNLDGKNEKIVLFLGRITMQKGPEYFLRAAKKVSQRLNNVKFIMAGDGDMLYRIIEEACRLGIGHNVMFTRFLRGDEVDKAYSRADLFVMSSVSEPFGIAALEALQHGVPVILSKNCGVAEVLHNALKVDFWDIDEMANQMYAVLQRPALHKMLSENGHSEANRLRWEDTAGKVKQIYEQVLAGVG
ncbi:MAG: glycosyltransferase family 4 protein [Sedimentisphaerales bacterium]|nr:glycosyltransferase family 4 protein [Sedimentisphaerales bacterium]